MNALYRSVAAIGVIAFVLAGCTTVTGRTAGRYIDDKTIQARVKTRLASADAATLTRVGVDTYQGTVYLTGIVDNEAAKRRIEEVAAAEGRPVVSNLQVRPPEPTARITSEGTLPARVEPAPEPPRHLSASPRTASDGFQGGTLAGEVTSVDVATGHLAIRAGEVTYDFQLPPSVVRDLRPGDPVAIDLSLRPSPVR